MIQKKQNEHLFVDDEAIYPHIVKKNLQDLFSTLDKTGKQFGITSWPRT